jgi:hypothetical protein
MTDRRYLYNSYLHWRRERVARRPEIARRILTVARSGIAFNFVAVLLISAEGYRHNLKEASGPGRYSRACRAGAANWS